MIRGTIMIAGLAVALAPSAHAAQKKSKKEAAPTTISVGRTPMTMPVEAPPVPPPPPAPTTTIAQALPTLDQHVQFNRLVQAAQIAPLLGGPGPLTLFAPSDDAFTRLAPGTLDTLLKPANATALATVLKYHAVAGAVSYDQLKAMIAQGGGTATLTTLAGQPLSATMENQLVVLTDANGGKSYISQPDIKETNGVVHVTNGVSVPRLG